MAEPSPPLPVKYWIAILFGNIEHLEKVKIRLSEEWGRFDFEGKDHLFDVTDYYEKEMGKPLYRRLLSFEKLYLPTILVEMKLKCNEIEKEFAIDGRRTVNLDCGYLDHNKYLLASVKEAGQKIYLDKGVYVDMCGRFKEGKYRPFEWTFPDFKDDRYSDELLEIRKRYMTQIKLHRKSLKSYC
ncbi:MAG: DUF4416 family protein [Chitinispirillaceae bacterium]|nr:DUF4416 family protein [Chitinispirillaceae bacterium]